MGKSDFSQMEKDELIEKVKELKEELFNLRFQHSIGQLENPARLKVIKRDIARAMTSVRSITGRRYRG